MVTQSLLLPMKFPEIKKYKSGPLQVVSKWKLYIDNVKEELFFIFLSYNIKGHIALLNPCDLSHERKRKFRLGIGSLKNSFLSSTYQGQ